jgi:hypothetical protein
LFSKPQTGHEDPDDLANKPWETEAQGCHDQWGRKITFASPPVGFTTSIKGPAITRIYRITIRPDGKWQGIETGAETPLILTHTRELAEEVIFDMAREKGNSRVLIFNSNHELVQERTFAAAPPKPDPGSWE